MDYMVKSELYHAPMMTTQGIMSDRNVIKKEEDLPSKKLKREKYQYVRGNFLGGVPPKR